MFDVYTEFVPTPIIIKLHSVKYVHTKKVKNKNKNS